MNDGVDSALPFAIDPNNRQTFDCLLSDQLAWLYLDFSLSNVVDHINFYSLGEA